MGNAVEPMKKNWILNKYILVISLLFSAFLSEAQELHEHRLNESKWEDIRDNIRYQDGSDGPGREWTYENQEDYNRAYKEWEKNGGSGNGGSGSGGGTGDGYGDGDGPSDRPQDRPQDYDVPESYDSPDMSMPSAPVSLGWIGWVLIGLLVGALIFLVVKMFLNAESDGKKITQTDIIEEINPTEIPLTELQRLLKEALDAKDYRGAIRIYFIFIIRDLTEKGLIQWEKEKTNFQYLRELSNYENYQDFNVSVSYFEIIWYGKRELDQSTFNQIKPNFTRFLDKLGVK